MEMILNEYDMVVGASFVDGTIQDYVDDSHLYGLIRVQDTTANWFLFHQQESDESLQELYQTVKLNEHYIHNDHGEEIVLFNKKGPSSFKVMVKYIDEYLNNELML